GVPTAAAFEHTSPQPGPQTLTVTRAGSYSRVTSQPPGIDCPPACSTSFPSQTFVILDFDRSPGAFWSGACNGRIHCSLVVDAPTDVTALAPPPPAPASPPRPRAQVDVTVSGLGLVASPDRR